MSEPAVIGALIGLAIGVVDFFILGYIRQLIGRRRPSERLGTGMALNVARVSQLILFPIVGWFVGPVVASNMGG